jgi:hypothetical protein
MEGSDCFVYSFLLWDQRTARIIRPTEELL